MKELLLAVSATLTISSGPMEIRAPELTQDETLTERYDAKELVRTYKGQQIRIAIIDTGYSPRFGSVPLKLCKTGHFDFMTSKPEVGSVSPHGSIVGAIIAEELQDVNYCAVIYQVVGPEGLTATTVQKAFEKAKTSGIAAINLSLSGRAHSFAEKNAIKAVADRGTVIFAAAGNDQMDLGNFCNSFPACYSIPNMYVVGATERENSYPARYTNYGTKVTIWLPGDYEFQGQVVEGTSFAAPRALSDYVYSLYLIQAKKQ
jgi:subtilisin family serine protease